MKKNTQILNRLTDFSTYGNLLTNRIKHTYPESELTNVMIPIDLQKHKSTLTLHYKLKTGFEFWVCISPDAHKMFTLSASGGGGLLQKTDNPNELNQLIDKLIQKQK